MARDKSPLAERIVTTSPYVTVSTNLGPWVNRRGIFARKPLADTFPDQQVPAAQKWVMGPEGQHLELGIADINLLPLLTELGPSHSPFGDLLPPHGPPYDPVLLRRLSARN